MIMDELTTYYLREYTMQRMIHGVILFIFTTLLLGEVTRYAGKNA